MNPEYANCFYLKNCFICSRNATYENLLGSNKPFAKRVPLSEMVTFLVNVWEHEGKYN
ncbi:hypothetical protein HanRHA438_Chr02g0049231 [Helianthus annuus]|nr:hypothetical protein HanRHA438_Chr02g0049231 [Helianthus annuus]